jgi:hypothetical protein
VTTEHQTTPEEEAYGRHLDEIREELSEPARTLLSEAQSAAYAENMVRSYCFGPEDYEEAMDRMRLAANKLTDRDCELLKAHVRAALMACASVDPFDQDSLAGYRVYSANLHDYYRMVADMVTDILWHREHLLTRERLAQEDPVDDADYPF